MSKSITLIGMPGAGKSTVGVVLAKILGYDFVDSDLLIQSEEGLLLWQIIERDGIDGFREIENRVNASINRKRTIIATGGSVVYCKEAMEHLCNTSIVVYLKLDYEKVASRLGDLTKRGVTLPNGYGLMDLYKERTPLYEKYAHLTFDCDNGSVRETAVKLAEYIKEYN